MNKTPESEFFRKHMIRALREVLTKEEDQAFTAYLHGIPYDDVVFDRVLRKLEAMVTP